MSRVDDARSGSVEGVHQARVASRRLREVVPVLGDGLSHVHLKRLRRRLSDLTRSLGPVRELDVALGMLADRAADTTDVAQLLARWRASLERQRRAPARALRKALSAPEMTLLDRDLRAFADARELSTDTRWHATLAERLDARADALREHIERAGALYQPDRLHDVRIAGKKLRYALELAGESRLASVAPMLRALKRAQDTLGHLHDLDVLAHLLDDVRGTRSGDALHAAAQAITAALDHESRWEHARYLRRRTALISVADATRDGVVPRVAAPRPARTRPRSPDGS